MLQDSSENDLLLKQVLAFLREHYQQNECVIYEDGRPAAYMVLVKKKKDEVWRIENGKMKRKQ